MRIGDRVKVGAEIGVVAAVFPDGFCFVQIEGTMRIHGAQVNTLHKLPPDPTSDH